MVLFVEYFFKNVWFAQACANLSKTVLHFRLKFAKANLISKTWLKVLVSLQV
jgi:hypothetical protein